MHEGKKRARLWAQEPPALGPRGHGQHVLHGLGRIVSAHGVLPFLHAPRDGHHARGGHHPPLRLHPRHGRSAKVVGYTGAGHVARRRGRRRRVAVLGMAPDPPRTSGERASAGGSSDDSGGGSSGAWGSLASSVAT